MDSGFGDQTEGSQHPHISFPDVCQWSPFSETRTNAVAMIEVRVLSHSKAVSLVYGACEVYDKLVAQ